MPVTTTHSTLTTTLAALKATQSSRPAVPILGAVRFTARDGSGVASAFDFDTLTEVRVGATALASGSLLVDLNALAKVTAALAQGTTKAKVADLPVLLTADGDTATVQADGYTFTLPALKVEDYPATDALTGLQSAFSVRVDRDALLAAVARAAVSVGKDNTLPMLTGFRLEVADGLLTVVTTDRYRLGVSPVPVEGDAEFTVQAAGNLPAIVRALPPGPVVVELLQSDGHTRFTAGDVTITQRVMDSEFVRYRLLLPTSFDRTVTVEVAKLAAAVQRVSAVVERGHPLVLDVTSVGLVVRTSDWRAVSPAVPAEVTVDAGFVQAFTATQLLDALGLFTGSVSFAVTKPTSPVLFAGCKAALADPAAFRHLLMPARLPS